MQLKESATKIVPANSILIVARVWSGENWLFPEKKICTSQDFLNFTPQKDDITFLGYYLKTKKNALLRFSQGMAIKGFTKDDISTLTLHFPPTPQEQQKIALVPVRFRTNSSMHPTEKTESFKRP